MSLFNGGLLGEQPSNNMQPMGLLSPEVQQLVSNGLLGGRFQPGANESWSDKLFGTRDPRDPRGPAMTAFSLGLMRGGRRGGFADGLEAYHRTYAAHEDKSMRNVANNLTLTKGLLELQGLVDANKRQQNIRGGLERLARDEQSEQNRAAVMPHMDAQPSDQFGTASVGGVPLFSMKGPEIFGPRPAATYQSPQPQGVMRGAMPQLNVPLAVGSQPAALGPGSFGSSRGNYGQGLSNRFLKQAEVYATHGDLATANKLYEQAARWMPEVHKIEVGMHQGQPVNVITMKDGNQVISAFGPAPKVHWADTGGEIRAIDEYTMGERGNFPKTGNPATDLLVADGRGGWQANAPLVSVKRQVAQAGAPQIRIENKMGEGIAAQVGPLVKSGFEGAQGALAQADAADRVFRAIDSGRLFTGPTANLEMFGAQLGQSLGLAGKNTQETIANTRAAIRGLAEFSLNARKSLQGQGQITENEQKLLDRAVSGDITLTAGEIRQIAGITRRQAQKTYQLHQANVQRLRSNPSTAGLADFYSLPDFPSDQGTTAPAAPAGKSFNSMPPANPSNKGKFLSDTQTGKRYQSNGMQWVEVR